MKYTVPNDDFTKLDELQKQIDTKLPPWHRADEEGIT